MACSASYLKRSLLLILLPLLLFGQALSQELEVQVKLDRSQINSTSLDYLDNLSNEIEAYFNEFDWISAEFGPEERINVDLQVTLLSTDDNFNFNAQVVFRSYRPIYNTAQQTLLFFYKDESWSFSYPPNRAFIHDELQFDALTSFLDFYAYLILGYDFDSFESLGGTPYFSTALNIASRAQAAAGSGWNRSSQDGQSRIKLVDELLSSGYSSLREAIYQYHRKGLDRFITQPSEARQQIIAALRQIKEAKNTTSSNLLFNIFFNSKYRELVSIFKDAKPEIQIEAFELLSDIDQSHLTEYRKLQ